MNQSQTVMDKNEIKKLIFAVLCIIVLEICFFRTYLFSDGLIGDPGDALLNNLIVEHWFNVFCGKETLDTLQILYPIHGTLAYTDMLFGLSLPYSFLRILGFDFLRANFYMQISTHVFGMIVFFIFLRYCLNLSVISGLLGAVLVFNSNGYYVRLGHTQFFAMAFIPIFLILAFSFWKNRNDNYKRVICGMGSIAILIFMLYTSWYVGFFVCFFLLISSLSGLVYLCLQKRKKIKRCFSILLKYKVEILGYLCVFGILLIPFFTLYIPVSRELGSWNWNEARAMLPHIYDYINVSGNNLLYGRFFKNTIFTSRPFSWELSMGYPFITFSLLLMSAYYYIAINKKKPYITILALTTLISFLLILKVNNFSLWYLVFKIIPGASAIRAVVRYLLLLSFPISIFVSSFVDTKYAESQSKWKNSILIVLLFVIIYENIVVSCVNNKWTISKQQTLITNISTPMNDLPFYLIGDKPELKYSGPEKQMLAWEIANKYNLNTINGYSGKVPKDWNLLDINSVKYIDSVNNWMYLNDIERLQCYNFTTNKWSIYNREERKGTIFLSGWSYGEKWGRWSVNKIAKVIPRLKDNSLPSKVSFTIAAFYEKKDIVVKCDSKIIGNIVADTEKETYVIPINGNTQKQITISFETKDRLKSPMELNLSSDSRKLGIALYDIYLQ